MKKYYATVGLIQVIEPHHYLHFFDKKNTSITAEELKDFFYDSKHELLLFSTLEEAKYYALEMIAIKIGNHNPEFYPHLHKQYTMPIYKIDVGDLVHDKIVKSRPKETLEVSWKHSNDWRDFYKNKLAKQLDIVQRKKDITIISGEKNDILNLAGVHIFHSDFKEPYFDINLEHDVTYFSARVNLSFKVT